jgi:hypothetical protein
MEPLSRARRMETMMPVSRDSRKQMKKTGQLDDKVMIQRERNTWCSKYVDHVECRLSLEESGDQSDKGGREGSIRYGESVLGGGSAEHLITLTQPQAVRPSQPMPAHAATHGKQRG